LVVGSGASAVNAASPLVAGGLRVRMLDFGNRDEVYESLVPAAPFSTIRRTDPNQHRYFLGDRYEGLALGRVSIGAQLTPPRQHVPRDTPALTPVISRTFFPLESLALGGLAAAWGAGCPPFIDADLAGFPITDRAFIARAGRWRSCCATPTSSIAPASSSSASTSPGTTWWKSSLTTCRPARASGTKRGRSSSPPGLSAPPGSCCVRSAATACAFRWSATRTPTPRC